MRKALLIGITLVVFNYYSDYAHATSIGCAEPNVLILLDVSDSMNNDDKYMKAQEAIHQVTASTDEIIRYGLMLFPSNYPYDYPPTSGSNLYCSTSTTLAVDFDTFNWSAIFHFLSPTFYNSTIENPGYFGGPQSENWTPMYQALDASKDLPQFNDPTRRQYVLLITDGKQNCCYQGDYDDEPDCVWLEGGGFTFAHPEYEENRADLVDMVTQIKDMGIQTFVVGFGDYVDDITLDEMAIAAGTAKSGCQDNGIDGDCYYKAGSSSEVELTQALSDISQVVTTEICDGIDNDCDGEVDEGVDEPCETECGSGLKRCINGILAPCDAPVATTEVCDGIDNNCNDKIDEGCPCVHGDTQECGNDVGACEKGIQTCDHGDWGECVGEVLPQEEYCDGEIDEDCDGDVDEGCKCYTDEKSECGTNVGICSVGEMICDNGSWGECIGGVRKELTDPCDGLDNDCDGEVDEYCSCSEGDTRVCGKDIGTCSTGNQGCVDGAWEEECHGGTVASQEICDNQDNDCDGQIDNDAVCPGDSECRCAVCSGPCSNGSCPAGGVCVEGICVVDNCPANQYCDGFTCVDGEAPNTEEQPTTIAADGRASSSGCGGGCNSAAGIPSHFLFIFSFLAFIQRRYLKNLF